MVDNYEGVGAYLLQVIVNEVWECRPHAHTVRRRRAICLARLHSSFRSHARQTVVSRAQGFFSLRSNYQTGSSFVQVCHTQVHIRNVRKKAHELLQLQAEALHTLRLEVPIQDWTRAANTRAAVQHERLRGRLRHRHRRRRFCNLRSTTTGIGTTI